MTSHFFATIAALLLASCASGCQRLQAYKDAWHAGADPNQRGAISVSVEPREGISILLDGSHVARVSPWHADDLPLGAHVLEVRGMGHYPMTLPVTLERDAPVHVPVRLRARPPQPFGPPAAPVDAAKNASATPTVPAPSAPSPSPAPPGRRPLPGNTRMLRLSIESRPAAAIVVDAVPADADNVQLLQGDGSLTIGEMQLAYHVRAGRGLDLVVPHEGALRSSWYVGALQVKAKSVVHLSAAPIVLRRRLAGRVQQATLRRLD